MILSPRIIRILCDINALAWRHVVLLLCVEVLVEGFRQYPAQRNAILDVIMGAVMPNLPMGKRTQREFLTGDASQLRIQMISALMLQLVQVFHLHPRLSVTFQHSVCIDAAAITVFHMHPTLSDTFTDGVHPGAAACTESFKLHLILSNLKLQLQMSSLWAACTVGS